MQLYKITLTTICLLVTLFSGAQTMAVEGGAHIVCEGSVFLVFDDMNIKNGGNIQAGNSLVKLDGTNYSPPSLIGGNSLTVFKNLIISNDVVLEQYVDVTGFLQLGTGILNLDDNVLTLPAVGYGLIGELESSRVTSNYGGYLTTTRSLNNPVQENPAHIGVEITSTANLGETEIQRGHHQMMTPGGLTLQRWVQIIPNNNSGLNATIRFHYFDAELISLNENDIVLWKSLDGGATWTEVGFTARNSFENWVEIEGENSLAMYSLAYSGMASLAADLHQEINAINDGQIERKMQLTATLSAWPNPVSNQINIQLESNSVKEVYLRLISPDGKLIRSEKVDLEKGINQFEQDVSNLLPGAYILSTDDPTIPAVNLIKQ